MSSLRRVPWYSSLEWLDVYNNAFSSSSEEARRAAISRISLWESKSSRVPVAVTCTKLFLEALLADSDGQQRVDVQMLYALAIVRFVNGHVDLEQKKVYAESIAVAARDIGIPGEVVNCRHKITHNEMPSIELLRHTADICFQYLEVHYWRDQVDVIRTRVQSMGNSKNLATGLVALLRDLEAVGVPDGFDQSLSVLVQDLKCKDTSRQQHISVQSLSLAAAMVCGLKPRDAIRTLKRLNLPELWGNTTFNAVISWTSSIRELLPKCLSFIDNLLHSCPNEDVTLSFLKDLVMAAYDPEVNSAAAICVIWILAKSSPNLSYRLISHILHCLAPHPTPAATAPEQGFDREAFSLWLKSVDISSEQESQLIGDLEHYGYEGRLLCWLRLLLLLPSTPDEDDTSLPAAIDLLLHIYCSPNLDSVITQSVVPSGSGSSRAVAAASASSSPLTSLHSLKDQFCRHLLYNINLVQSRILSDCRSSLQGVALFTLETLITKTLPINLQETEILQQLLRIFNEAAIKLPHSTSSKLLDWFSSHLPITAGRLPRKLVLDRFFSDFKRTTSTTRLIEEFQSILLRLRSSTTSGSPQGASSSSIAELRDQIRAFRQQMAFSTLTSNVRVVSTAATPWTLPGTLASSLSFPGDIIQTMPTQATHNISEVLRYGESPFESTTTTTGLVSGSSRKRPAPFSNDGVEGHEVSQHSEVKRFRGGHRDEELLINGDNRTGGITQHHDHADKYTLPAIRELQERILEQQLQQHSLGASSTANVLAEWSDINSQLMLSVLTEDAVMQQPQQR